MATENTWSHDSERSLGGKLMKMDYESIDYYISDFPISD
jgi:hypothetical protein